jgi:DNA-binding transcriptional ArsR family regulator
VYSHIPASSVTVTITHSAPTADSILTALDVSLPSTAMKLYLLLHETALHALSASGHTIAPNQFVIHQPVEVMAVALAVSRVTLYKHLKTLRQLGLIDSRGHTGSWFGLSRKTGTLFAVSLKPGHRARVRFDDLRYKHRDLEADTQSGTRTAWRFLQGLQSLPKRKERAHNALKHWAVNPGHTDNVVNHDRKPGLADTVYTLETLLTTHSSKRAEMVDRYAHALSHGFIDSTNLNFWRKLLWDTLKRDGEGLDTLYQLQCALTRLRADVAEVECLRSGGALLVSRLKACGLWDTLKYA